MKQYLNKNILFSVNLPGRDGMVHDGIVEKFSPSGNYVRIDFSWYAVNTISVLEEVSATETTVQVAPPAVQASEPAPATAPAPVSEAPAPAAAAAEQAPEAAAQA